MTKYLLAALLSIFLVGCGESPTPETSNALADENAISADVVKHNIQLAHQTVTVVPYKETVQWLKDHKHIFVHSIAPIDRSGHGATSGYIIVWSTPITH